MLPKNFISELMPGAVNVQLKYTLPAAAMIAEAAEETEWGKYITYDYKTGRSSNSFFNIKGTDGPAGYVTAWTLEYENNQWVRVLADFKAYHNYEESFAGYAALITQDPRYKPALAVANDPIAYVKELQACGYATNPEYSRQIIEIMQEFNIIQEVEKYMAEQVQEPDGWAKDAWEWGVKTGITHGQNPRENITREQVVEMMYQYDLKQKEKTNA